MDNETRKQLEHKLRLARQNVFDDKTKERVITECKALLLPVYEKESIARKTKELERWLLIN